MTYFLIQSAAMFLVAYFAGCWLGCFYKTLATSGLRTSTSNNAPDLVPAPVAPRTAPVPPSAPRPVAPTAVKAPAPVVQPPAPAPVRPVQSPPAVVTAPVTAAPGTRISPEVTAAAAAAAMASRPAAGATAVADDLKRIKGIGPEIERKLNAMGVRRYSEIAGWTSADVARVNREIGQEGRVQHENWIEQAQILGRGGETAFSRRVDRREVTDGAQGTWTPTAPNEVARQAAAGTPASVQPPAASSLARPMPPAQSPAIAASGAAAAAAAAAIAGMSGGAVRQPSPLPAAPPATSSTSTVATPLPPAKPPAPPVATATPPAAAAPISMRPAAGTGNQRRFVRLAAPEGRPDDLALIGGVGDKIAGDLNRYGIYHYWQLASMGPDDIDYLESRLSFRGRMRREEWPEQARELMAGKPPRARMDRDRLPQGPSVPNNPQVVEPARAPVVTPAASPVRPAQLPPVQTAPAVTVATPPSSPTPASAAARPLPPVAPVQPAPAVQTPPSATPPAAPQQASMQTQPLPPMTAIAAAAAAVAAAAASATSLGASRTPVQPTAAVAQTAPPPVVSAAPARTTPTMAQPADASTDPANPGWTPRSRPATGTARVRDDLKRIKGIGVVIEKRLEAMGITSYTQIAAWATSDVDQVSNALDFKGRIEREQWVQQARILSGGGQTDFSRRMDRGDGTGV